MTAAPDRYTVAPFESAWAVCDQTGAIVIAGLNNSQAWEFVDRKSGEDQPIARSRATGSPIRNEDGWD
jgi:hypothetical protein